MEIQNRSKWYVLPTIYRHPTETSPTVGRLFACWPKPVGGLSDNSRSTVGQQSTDRRLTGYFGNCSSQLPHLFVMSRIFNLLPAFVTSVDSVSNMSSLLLTQVSIPERVSADEFLEWMIAEPQTIVWLPTLHRLAVSETGTVWVIPNFSMSLFVIRVNLFHP